MLRRPTSLIALGEDALETTYGVAERARIAAMTRVVAPPQTARSVAANPELLREVELLITGWGGPRLDARLLARAPALRAVFYGGGSVAPIMTPDAWDRGLAVTSAAAANAIAVAEYTVSMLILSLKGAWRLAREMRATRIWPCADARDGACGRCVGLVSLGAVGRAVVERLRGLETTILAYDPFVAAVDADALGVALTPLDELFARADAVSVHAPLLPTTVNLVRAEHLAAMKHHATFINTSRGAVVDEEALIGIASCRPDLQIVLDVTRSMPLASSSPLYALPNVLLTPHIAGSRSRECRRMGRLIVEEIERYVAGEPLKWRVASAALDRTCHASLDVCVSAPETSLGNTDLESCPTRV